MNSVSMIGRLTNDPEIRYSNGDNPCCIAVFTLAVDRVFKRDGDPDADFVRCRAFGKTAEVIERNVGKGRLIGVSGRIQTGSYENREGQRVFTTEVIINEITFCTPRPDSAGKQQDSRKQPVDDEGFRNIPDGIDEELPFN